MCIRDRAKGVTKKVAEPASKPGERLYFDIAGPYSTSLGGSTYWVMAVDDHSRYKYSGFTFSRKSRLLDIRSSTSVATTRARISGTYRMLVIKRRA